MAKSPKGLRSSRKSKSLPATIDCRALHPALGAIVADAFLLCAPPPDFTVSQWADKYRYLSRKDSAEPGRWKTSRAEYGREIMDTITEPDVSEVVVVKASQVGWTAILANVVGYFVDLDPCPMLIMQPTKKMAEAWSKDRLAPTIEETPRLSEKMAPAKSRDGANTILNKTFPGGYLSIIGANVAAELASRPIRIGLCDETERYPLSAGGEGDPMKLLSKRLETFWNSKQLKGSTPKLKGGPILRDYDRSDKRKFFVPCEHCGAEQDLRWEQVKWDKDAETGEHKPETAAYQCEGCGVLWDDTDRHEAVRKGAWKATAPFKGVAGFFLPKFYSPFVSLADVVVEFLEAKGSPELMQVFVNTVLAEGWEEQGESVEKEGLAARAEIYGPEELPAGVVFATVGVDTQNDRLEAQVIGWGVGEESWPIEYHVLNGDPAQQDVWDALDELRLRRYTTRDGRTVRTLACGVDAGGHHAASVHAYCKTRRKQRVYALNGQSGPRLIWPRQASKAGVKGRDKVMTIGVDTAKDQIYGRLNIQRDADKPDDEAQAGYIHFPADPELGFGDDYFAQLTVEKVLTRYKNGKPYRVWSCPKGARNEALDTFVYALAVRQSVPIKLQNTTSVRRYLSRRAGEVAAEKAREPMPTDTPPAEQTATPKRKSRQRGRSGWVNRRGGGSWLGR